MLRRWRAAWPRRSKRFDPRWQQGTQTQAFPGLVEPAGPRPRFAANLRRGRFTEPPWPQGARSQPFPGITEPAGSRPRWSPSRFARRGRFAEPPWPQGPKATPAPAIYDPAGPRPPRFPARPRRGQFFTAPFPTVVSAVPQVAATRARLRGPVRRGVFFAPPLRQAAQGQPFPTMTSGRRTARTRRARWFEPPWPQAPQTQAFPLFTSSRRTARTRRGKFLEPTWPQGTQGVPLAGFGRQAARVRAAVPRRTRFFETVPLVAAAGLPGFTRASRRSVRARKGVFLGGPWSQGNQGQPLASYVRPSVRVRGLVLRRGRFLPVPPSPLAAVVPSFQRAAVRAARTRRSRFFEAPPSAVALPGTIPAGIRYGRRPLVRPPRGHHFGFTPSQPPGWVPPLICGRHPLVRPVRRGSIYSTGLTTVAVWVPCPLTTRRSPAIGVRRGRFTEPVWLQGPLAPGWVPSHTKPGRRPVATKRRPLVLASTVTLDLPVVVPVLAGTAVVFGRADGAAVVSGRPDGSAVATGRTAVAATTTGRLDGIALVSGRVDGAVT